MHLLDEFSEKCEYCGYTVISKEFPLFVVSCFNLTNANKCVMSVFVIGWKNRVFYEDRIVESSTADKPLVIYSPRSSKYLKKWKKWKWYDMLVIPILGICALSALTHPKCTHSSEHTHREHTPGAVGSYLVRCLAQGHLSRGIEAGRERWLFTPPTHNSCQTWNSNLNSRPTL